MRLTRIILTALVVAACAPAAKPSGYAPKWHVGDWWVIKTWERSNSGFGDGWEWNTTRYDVADIVRIRGRRCFVLETRHGASKESLSQPWNVLYVRADNWLVVRQVVTVTYHGTTSPVVTDCPLGLFGPFQGGEPRLPRFPLQLANPDTTFKLQKRDDCSAWLREISEVADSTLVNRLLDEGDTAGGRVVRPTGVVYQLRNESGFTSPLVQSLQFWCDGQPWRVYEELADYDRPKPGRRIEERSWLIASGHSGK